MTPTAVAASFWLPRHRVAVPEPPYRYCDRPELTRQCTPANESIVVLLAPGGFGKTTLLAAACRGAVTRRVPVAWVTLSRDDEPGDLDAHLAFAFQEAGIDLLGPLGRGETGLGHAYPRTALLIRALAERRLPCILALDEAEHASDPAAVALLNHLLRNAPPCLHIAIACRELPPGLDLAQPVFSQRATVLTAEDLRFSKAEIARFFDLELSREQLAAVATESSGWPIALRIRRNAASRQGAADARAARHLVDNWIDGRFWEGFSDGDREQILDIGMLEWVDAALIDEVLDDTAALERLLALPRLAGLLEPAGPSAAAVYRLHPLLHEYCVDQRRKEKPARFREVHRRCALALARRGATLDAMRHAALANDPALVGSILLEAGALQWWLRAGAERLLAADRLLPDATLDEPRLAMVRYMALFLQGRVRDARRAFASAPARPNDPAFEVDQLLVRGAFVINASEPVADDVPQAMETEAARIADRPGTPALVRGILAYGRSVGQARRSEFNAAVALAREGREAVAGRSVYLTTILDSQLGQVAMVRGHVREALRRYRNADRMAKACFLEDPRLTHFVGLLLRELALERNRMDGSDNPRRIVQEVYRRGHRFSHYAAAADLVVALALDADGPGAALHLIEEMGESARGAGFDLLLRHLATLRVSLLAQAQDVDAAWRTWRAAGLPETDAQCLVAGTGGWRGLEAVTCARIRLLTATGETAAAGDLIRALVRTAQECSLRRTLMRALALGVRLCHRTGDRNAAREAAAQYLGLYARTDYARPLVLAGTAAATALDRIIDADPDGPNAAAAERLIAMGRDGVPAKPRLTGRQKAVLGRLVSQQDKEIAAALGMTQHGVRYQIRTIFKKLSVHSRTDAVRRARALGLLAPGDP